MFSACDYAEPKSLTTSHGGNVFDPLAPPQPTQVKTTSGGDGWWLSKRHWPLVTAASVDSKTLAAERWPSSGIKNRLSANGTETRCRAGRDDVETLPLGQDIVRVASIPPDALNDCGFLS